MTNTMIILNRGNGIAVCATQKDINAGNARFYAMSYGNYYDPTQNFLPVMNEDKTLRRPKGNFAENYNKLVDKAQENFDKLHAEAEAQPTGEPQVVYKTVPQPQTASAGLGGQLEKIMLEVLAAQSVDKVIEIAKPMLDDHIKETFGILPQVHTVVTPTKTTQIKGVLHEEFDTVLQLVNCDIPVFLTGGAGTGKNVICQQVAEATGLEFYFSNAVTQEYKLTGFIDANGTYHETQFYKAFTQGGVFMLDEMDASIPEVLIILNAAIANRYFDFPTGRVQAHENFRLIAAGNTFGTGADIEYTGRFQLDAASLDRFAIVEIDYSPAIEEAVANGDTELVTFIRAFRQACQQSGIKHLATYRAISRIAKLSEIMETAKVLKMALTKNLSHDDINIIVNAMTGVPSGNKYFTAIKGM